MPYLGVLGSNFQNPLSYLQSVPSNFPYFKVWCKKKKKQSLNLGPKMPDFRILGLRFKSIIGVF